MVVEAVAMAGFTAAALYVWSDTTSFVLGQLAAAMLLIVLSRYVVPWPSRVAKHPGAGHPAVATAAAENRPAQRPDAGEAGTGFRQRAFEYGMPFAPLALAGWLSNLADRYVLGAVLGAAAVGQYVAPLAIASRAMIMASGALNDLFRPTLFDAENRGQRSRANSVFKRWIAVNVMVGCAAVAFIAVMGDRMVGLLLGRGYREGAVAIMVWVASGYGIYGLTQVLETRLLSLGRSGQLLIPMAAGAVANMAFSSLFVPRFGIIGAARASCLSFVAQCIVTTLFLIAALRRRNAPATV
jgi:O-antigen/teichoic acid export membrane protein